jgi:hypothetical protein
MGKSDKIVRQGAGRLVVAGSEQEVRYNYSLASENSGRHSAKGAIEGPPDIMRQAFRQGLCRLRLDEDTGWSVHVVAHSLGSATAYFVVEDVPKTVAGPKAPPAVTKT